MYFQRFGLTGRPFPATPDCAVYYPATQHEAILADLLRAVTEDQGFALLSGQPGTGKTLLAQCLLDRLGEGVTSACLTHSHFPDRAALLQAILYDLCLPHDTGREQDLRLRLTDFLLENCAAGKRAVLIVDEAQHLDADHLEELRLLGNLEAGKGKAFQVVLIGQAGILDTLARPELSAVSQRITVPCSLEPLALEEGIDYLLHHLRLAGGRPERIFDESALEILARGAHGIPRLLNQAGHQALTLAHQADLERVDSEAALETLALLGLADDQTEPLSPDATDCELGLLRNEEEVEGAPDSPSCRLFDSPRRPA